MLDSSTLRKLWLTWLIHMSLFCRVAWPQIRGAKQLRRRDQEWTKVTSVRTCPKIPPPHVIICCHFLSTRPMKRLDSLMCTPRKEETSFCPYIKSAYSIQPTYHPVTSWLLPLKAPNPRPLWRPIWEIFSHLLASHPAIKPFLLQNRCQHLAYVHHRAMGPHRVTFLCETFNFQCCQIKHFKAQLKDLASWDAKCDPSNKEWTFSFSSIVHHKFLLITHFEE